MANHVLLDNVTHKDLRIRQDYRAGAALEVNLARVFPIEFNPLQREYALFFVKDTESGKFEPVALLGFAAGENLYLREGQWDATYVPLTIARQPFLIGFQERVEDGVPKKAPVVHIDMDDPRVNTEEGERVFLEQGGESPFLQQMSSILMAIHEGHETNASFTQSLVGLELIESVSLKVELKDGSKTALDGLYTVNEEKLAGLGGNALEVLHSKGYLQSVFLMLASLQNVQQLIVRKNQSLVSQ